MKKVVFFAALFALLCAGCAKTNEQAMVKESTGKQTNEQHMTDQGSSDAMSAKEEVKPVVNVTVNNPDDAINIIEKNATSEQAAVTAADDSDLSTADSADLNSLSEVPNGN